MMEIDIERDMVQVGFIIGYAQIIIQQIYKYYVGIVTVQKVFMGNAHITYDGYK